MLSVVGKLVKKESKGNNKAEMILEEISGNLLSFQVRRNEIHKIINVDAGQCLRVCYRSELREVKKKSIARINNLILVDVETI